MPKRLLQLALVVLLAMPMLAAGDSFDSLGHQLICQCGCGQILLECNHVGCPVSGPMLEELKTQVASGLPGAGVLNWFVGKYGPIVLAAPVRGGFDRVAWIVPFAVLVLAIVGVAMLVRLWHRRTTRLAPSAPAGAPMSFPDEMRERIRRETEPHF
jgi:cytochrome c-type biogenesis protein CcmH/NrfF